MAKSIEDFDQLITAVYGDTTPQARQYWMARMLNEDRDWNWVGGTMAYFKRNGRKLSDYGTAVPVPSIIQSKVHKEALVKQAPITHAGKGVTMGMIEMPVLKAKDPIKPKLAVMPYQSEALKDLVKPVKSAPETKVKTPTVGGGVEGGTVALRNLWLPFAIVVGVVLTVFALRPKKRKR